MEVRIVNRGVQCPMLSELFITLKMRVSEKRLLSEFAEFQGDVCYTTVLPYWICSFNDIPEKKKKKEKNIC